MFSKLVRWLFVVVFISCTSSNETTKKEKLDAFIADFNEEIKDRYDIQSLPYGGDFLGKIRRIDLKFTSGYGLDKTKAIFLVQRISDDFLFYINRDTDLIRWMQSFPLKREQLDISIDFFSSKDLPINNLSVSKVELRQGKIYTYKFDADKKENALL